MCDRNGKSSNSSVTGSNLEGAEDSFNARSCEGASFESLRSFQYKPAVVVERLDIGPFAEKIQSPVVNNNSSVSKPQVLFDKFHAQCHVNLVSYDLKKLKVVCKNKSNIPIIEMDTNIKCKICGKIYSSEKKLLNHQENKHMIVYRPKPKSKKRVSFSDKVIIHEVTEYHKCRKCPKIFESYKSLKGHMKEQHKKRKCYICNYCSKKFVDRMFFKVHIKLHCEVCGLLLPNKTRFLEHKRLVCKTAKLYKCKTCDITLFKFMDLKDHSYEHISTCYVCDICKDQCMTKCAVAHHIYFLHTTKRRKRNPALYFTRKLGSESLYLCKFCDESSVDKDLIEKHVAVLPDLTNRAMTGYKDYYFCDQCMKKFDTEKNMLQHKWTHFLKTPDNSQVRPKSILFSILTNNINPTKTFYNVNGKIPDHFKPKVVVEWMNFMKYLGEAEPQVAVQPAAPPPQLTPINCEETKNTEEINIEEKDGEITNAETIDNVINNAETKKAPTKRAENKNALIVSRRTIISKYQCQNCGKYFSSNSSLTRHVETQHFDFENLRCKVCEEVFVWPSLLQSHKCIRLKIPEMPFQDARPEIHFTNYSPVQNTRQSTDSLNQDDNGFDDLNLPLVEDDNYMNSIDFEIPAPIVQVEEMRNSIVPNQVLNQSVNEKLLPLQSLGYKVVMQEVPIEF